MESISLIRCRGQALPLGLAFLMFVSLAGIILYNSSQLVSKKSHIANAADAAAYSGLVWQARALNFQAYTNRAMVANQVSIAQFVSIASWTEYGKISARNINTAIGWIPPVAPFTQGAEQAMLQVDNIVGQVANVVVPIISGVNQVLSAVQQAVYYSTFAVTPSIVKEVAKANDDDYDVETAYSIASMGLNVVDWQGFTEQYDGDDLNRKADVINRSRDRFTRDRGWDVGRFTIWPLRFHLRKEGATHLIQEDGEWAWKAKDTLSLHHWRFGCSWKGCKWRHSELPIGWGGAYASDDLQCRGSNCPSWEIHNRSAGRQAERESDSVNGYGGVQAFFDLSDLSAQNQDPRLLLRVEVQAPRSSMETSTQKGFGSSKEVSAAADKSGFGNGMFRLEDEFAKNTMASMSSAEVYFERPTFNNNELRVDGLEKHEYGSLWNPYWQVRLASTPKEQRFAAWAMRDDSLVSGVGGAVGGGRAYARTQQEELGELVDLAQYAEDQIDELPASLADKLEITQDLQNIVSQAQSLENDILAVSGELENAKDNLDFSTAQRDAIDSEVNALAARLEGVVDSAEAQQITNQISALNEQKNAVNQQINEATGQLTDLRQSYQDQLADMTDLNAQGSEIASRLGLLDRQIAGAEDLQAVVADVEELIGSTRDSISNADISAAQEYLGGLRYAEDVVATLSGDALSATKDRLMEQGKEQLQNFVEDAITDKLKDVFSNAIESAIKGFFGNYTDDVERFSQKIQETSDSAEEFLNEVSVEYIQPLEDQLATLKQEQGQLRDRLQSELDSAVEQMNSDIQYYENLVRDEADRITDGLQPQIDDLISRRIDAETQDARDSLSDQIAELEARRDAELASIEDSYGLRLAGLRDRKQEIIDEFNNNLSAIRNDIEGEIAELEQQIASLKSRVGAG